MASAFLTAFVLSFLSHSSAYENEAATETLSHNEKKNPVDTDVQQVYDVEVENAQDFSLTWPNDLGFDTVREEREPIILDVTGYIPLYAAGTLYRIGPGAYRLRSTSGQLKYECSHWFDGFAQLHKFELVRGKDRIESITYSSRISVDSLMENIAKTGNYDGYTFAQKRDPCMSMFRKVMCLFTPVPTAKPNEANIPVTISRNSVGFPSSKLPHKYKVGQVGHLIARTDEGHLKALDSSTLEPIGVAHQKELNPLLKGPLSASHSKSDPETGDVFNYNLDLGMAAVYRVFRTSARRGETEILAAISAPDLAPAYMHSFFMSENFIILGVWSAHLQAYGLKVLWEKNVLDAIAPFDSARTCKWFVVDKCHGRGVVAAFESPAGFCFHTVNAYEVPSEDEALGNTDLICDMIEYDNLDVLHKFYYVNMKASSPTSAKWMREKQPGCNQHFARYRLSKIPNVQDLPSLSKTERENKSPIPIARSAERVMTIANPIAGDMPNINPRFAMKPYRYFWNCTFDTTRSTLMDSLCKVDTLTKTGLRWQNPPGHSPGEAIFIPDPASDEEDAGILSTIVLDGFRGESYLLCLDARTMQELGRADCHGPLPFSFHGQHVVDGRRPLDV